ncbi:MAG: hypothetical protein FWE19_00340 [Oscillospiraceae bacterium]|nr:hypothetical protein [Oscillospiraceae bacterium]
MKGFKNITELELLHAAWRTLTTKMIRAYDKIQVNNRADLNRPLLEKYSAQIEEIHERIVELERAETQ